MNDKLSPVLMGKINKFVFLAVVALFLIWPAIGLASVKNNPSIVLDTQLGGTVRENENALPDYIQLFWNRILPIAVGLTVLVIMYGGYRYITSAGNPEALTAAKDIIISAIVGLVLLLLAWVIWEQIRYPVTDYTLNGDSSAPPSTPTPTTP